MKGNKSLLRRMGYSSDSQGIIDRYIHVNGAWDSHLRNCRQFIIQCVQQRKIGKLAVYGSGWLLDLPLSDLAEKVEQITLFDIVHPAQVVQKVNKFRNVHLETVDLTGGILNQAYEAAVHFRKKKEIPDFGKWADFRFTHPVAFDYSISLNLLSQIGELVTNYLKQHLPLDENETNRITGMLQKAHLDILEPKKSCLITDIQEKLIGENPYGDGIRKLIHCSLVIPADAKKWEWHFDPLKEYHPGFQTVSDVIAFER